MNQPRTIQRKRILPETGLAILCPCAAEKILLLPGLSAALRRMVRAWDAYRWLVEYACRVAWITSKG